MPKRVWIDTDVGSDVDDALAIAYVMRHPQLELAGISTVFGAVELRTRIVDELLKRGRAAGIPVVTGLGAPLTPGRVGVMFGHEGEGLVEDPGSLAPRSEDPDASDRVRALRAAIEGARPDHLVAIGPLTNLGALLRAGASLPPLHIMGGRVDELEGRAIAEWNFYCDPDAARDVIAAANEPVVVPADVTFRTAFELPGDLERLEAHDELSRTLAELARIWLVAQTERLGFERAAVMLHDPLTAAMLVRPELCRLEELAIEITDPGGARRSNADPNARVALDVDPQQTRHEVLETLLR